MIWILKALFEHFNKGASIYSCLNKSRLLDLSTMDPLTYFGFCWVLTSLDGTHTSFQIDQNKSLSIFALYNLTHPVSFLMILPLFLKIKFSHILAKLFSAKDKDSIALLYKIIQEYTIATERNEWNTTQKTLRKKWPMKTCQHIRIKA